MDRPAESLDYVRRSIAAAEPFGTDLYVAAAMGMGSVLSERGDPAAAGYAHDAVARCRDGGSAEQLAALLPTAAMVCWQVGAIDEARRHVDEARPMHVGTRRIARVVLLSTSVGIALYDGDLEAAVELGTIADAEATELGVERELPLLRSMLARALSSAGDHAGAARVVSTALDVATGMSLRYPTAVCLETAALVLAQHAPAVDLAALLAAATAIRRAGDRPPPVTLRPAVDELRARVGDGTDPGRTAAVALARGLLSGHLDG